MRPLIEKLQLKQNVAKGKREKNHTERARMSERRGKYPSERGKSTRNTWRGQGRGWGGVSLHVDLAAAGGAVEDVVVLEAAQVVEGGDDADGAEHNQDDHVVRVALAHHHVELLNATYR